MPAIYLTPAALGFLSQFILALLIAGYFVTRLLMRRANRSAHWLLLTGFFICIALLTFLLFAESALPLHQRLHPLFLQTPALALGIVLLLQFAYRFPEPRRNKWEPLLVLALSLVYLGYEAVFAVTRFVQLAEGEIIYRINWADLPIAAGLLWAPIVLVRQSLAASARQVRQDGTGAENASGLRFLWRPQGRAARAALALALIYLLPFGISLLNILRSLYQISPEFLQIGRAVGIMATLGLFVVIYLNYLPETTSFMVRLVGVTLTVVLAALGAVGWLITPAYAAAYQPVFPDQHTLRFTPNQTGGYDISLAPLHFERELGADLHLSNQYIVGESLEPGSGGYAARLDFVFLFFGKTYDKVFVNNDGAIALGSNLDSFFSYSLSYGSNIPFLFPLLLDLNPEAGGGVFVRQEPERLIVTWLRQPAFYHPEDIYTFQAILYADGIFEFRYDGLPDALTYQPADESAAVPWVIGATPGEPPQAPQIVDLGQLASGGIISGGQQGMVQDYYLDFRQHLDTLLHPLFYLMIGVSLFVLLVFPLMFWVNLGRPLASLLAGVRRANAGDLQTAIPIHYPDEIGFLTDHFNRSVARLRDVLAGLEARVAERTADLSRVNKQLHREIDQREAAQAQVLQQQRALVAAEEREHMSRELHDGLGQVMGYINVQSQAVQAMLAEGQMDAARANLQQMTQAAQEAHADIRNYILGLRQPALAPGDLRQSIETHVRQFAESSGVKATFSYPPNPPRAPFTPAVEEQVLRIVQEALSNVRKHAHATHAEVLFNFTDDQAQVIISDDGVGFQVPESQSDGHFGLSIIRERAAQVGGHLEIRSTPGHGTKVLLTLPCAAASPDQQAIMGDIRALLVDDHPLFLDGLRTLLVARGINVIGLAHDGLEAQQQARALRPNLILMDLQMPRCGGLEAVRAIKAEMPQVKIVMLTVSDSEDDLFEAVKSGASGYLTKNLDVNEMVDLLAGVVAGEASLPPAMVTRLVQDMASSATHPDKVDSVGIPADLTPRQWEILKLVAAGMTYKEVGARLYLSVDGVKYHMGQILDRLHMANREQAIAYARRIESGKQGG